MLCSALAKSSGEGLWPGTHLTQWYFSVSLVSAVTLSKAILSPVKFRLLLLYLGTLETKRQLTDLFLEMWQPKSHTVS